VGHFDQVAYLGLPVFHHLALAVDQQHGEQQSQCTEREDGHGQQFAVQRHTLVRHGRGLPGCVFGENVKNNNRTLA
jgi:hypothetical protein